MADSLAHKELFTSLSGSFKTGKYYDLTIKCKAREWKVHRAIICGRSKFFEKACDGDWIEAKSKVIKLPEDDLDDVERMLFFLYTFDYTGPPATGKSNRSPALLVDFHMYLMADKYDITSLKAKACEKFKAIASKADVWNEPGIVQVLQAVRQGTPKDDSGVRPILRTYMQAWVSNFARVKQVQELVRSDGDFAVDLVQMLLKTPATPSWL